MNCYFIPVENYIILIEIRNRGKVDKINGIENISRNPNDNSIQIIHNNIN